MKKLCEFSNVEAHWADLGSTETVEQKLKFASFEGGFLSFSESKKSFQIFQHPHNFLWKSLTEKRIRRLALFVLR